MSWFADIFKGVQEIPLSAVLKERIALYEDKYKALELENHKLKAQVASLEEKLEAFKSKTDPKPKIKWGCYQFEGEEGLYCPACYDTKGKKRLTTRATSRHRMCSVCGATLGAG